MGAVRTTGLSEVKFVSNDYTTLTLNYAGYGNNYASRTVGAYLWLMIMSISQLAAILILSNN